MPLTVKIHQARQAARIREMKEKEWFNRADVKRIIKEIDNTTAVKDEYMNLRYTAQYRLKDYLQGVIDLGEYLKDAFLYKR